MRPLSTLGRAVVLLLLAAGSARAVPILDVTSALTTGDPVQMGRLTRAGIPQDWAGTELFPGSLNPSTAFRYHVYAVNVGLTPFVQVMIDSVSTSTFVSAYDASYNPLSFATNWLGDAGFSGNAFGVDPLFFQVIVPLHHDLLVVVNNTVAGDVGVGDPFRILVEGFVDTEFTDPAAVPEPDTLLLTGAGLILLAAVRLVRQTA